MRNVPKLYVPKQPLPADTPVFDGRFLTWTSYNQTTKVDMTQVSAIGGSDSSGFRLNIHGEGYYPPGSFETLEGYWRVALGIPFGMGD